MLEIQKEKCICNTTIVDNDEQMLYATNDEVVRI